MEDDQPTLLAEQHSFLLREQIGGSTREVQPFG